MSNRDITAGAQAQIDAETCSFAVFVELDFQSGFVRLCNASVTLSWNTHSWVGIGDLGSIQVISESADLEAKGVAMALSGIPSSSISTALGEYYQGRSCKIWFAPLDPTTDLPVADPVMVFDGRIDNMQIELDTTATITVSAESRLADWDRPRVRRFNDADQKSVYPTDRGFEFVEQMVEKELTWG